MLAGRTHDERLTIWINRYDEAREAGMDEGEAREFAYSDRDIGELRDLVRRGCPPKLIARLVL
jgi:hypothetical protein